MKKILLLPFIFTSLLMGKVNLTVLFIIDGLHYKAPEKIPLINFLNLQKEGTRYKEVYLPLPAHPKKNDDLNSQYYYPWGSSIPNQVMMTGTVFIGKPDIKNNLLQYYFKENKYTAHITNCSAYNEISEGYIYYFLTQKEGEEFDDETVINKAKEIIENYPIAFLRLHLQATGSGGYEDREKKKIWDRNSKYREKIIIADKLLGDFVLWLKEKGIFDKSIIFILGDHGQNENGWHPPYEKESDITTMLIIGSKVKKGKVYPYAEIIDIFPTICWLHNIKIPEHSQGRILKEAFTGGVLEKRENYIKRLNETIKRYNFLKNKYKIEEPDILKIEEIGTWHKKFNDLPSIVKNNEDILKKIMKKEKYEN